MPVDPESAAKQSKPVAPKKPPARYIEGMASYYGCGDGFHSSGTASGEVFDEKKLTTAHYDLAFGTRLEVANLSNGKKVEVRVNDRGPFEKKNGKWVRHSTRILDLSCRAAELLDFKSAGLTRVRARILD
jgi:rare lipoprotein A